MRKTVVTIMLPAVMSALWGVLACYSPKSPLPSIAEGREQPADSLLSLAEQGDMEAQVPEAPHPLPAL